MAFKAALTSVPCVFYEWLRFIHGARALLKVQSCLHEITAHTHDDCCTDIVINLSINNYKIDLIMIIYIFDKQMTSHHANTVYSI